MSALSPNRIVQIGGRRFDVPRDYCLVEWVGEKSPLADDYIYALMMTDFISPVQKKVLRIMAKDAILRGDQNTIRIMKSERGIGDVRMSVREVRWGPNRKAFPGQPGSYIQMVTIRDARALQSSTSGHEFVVYGDPEEKPKDPVDKLVMPKHDIHIVKREEMRPGRVGWEAARRR